MRFREKKPVTPWEVTIQPDSILDEKWIDDDGNHFWKGKAGWTYILQRENPPAFGIGGAETYEECLLLAREEMTERS